MRGPVPKRSEHRRRKNVPEGPALRKAPGAAVVKPPAEDKDWHIAAKRWFRALKKSGQSQFYEPSDWAFAQWACDLMTKEMSREDPRAAMIGELTSMMDNLLTSEGARRRLRVELQRGEDSSDGDADVVVMSMYKDLGGTG